MKAITVGNIILQTYQKIFEKELFALNYLSTFLGLL